MSTSTAGTAALKSEVDLNKMQADVAVLTERTGNIGQRIDTILLNQEKALGTFATKEELKVVKDSVDSVKSWLSWGVKVVLGALLVALVGLVVAKGGPHP